MQGVRFNFKVKEVYEYISQPGQTIIVRENFTLRFFVCPLTFMKKRFLKDRGNILLTNVLSQIDIGIIYVRIYILSRPTNAVKQTVIDRVDDVSCFYKCLCH